VAAASERDQSVYIQKEIIRSMMLEKTNLRSIANGTLGDGVVFEALGIHKKTVIFMHGLGDSCSGWTELPKFFNRTHKLSDEIEIVDSIKFILPSASVRPVSINGGMPTPAWFDIFGLDEGSPVDLEGIRSSMDILDAIIDHELANNDKMGRGDIVIGGFSQGGAVAYQYFMERKRDIGGMINLSTWIPSIENAKCDSECDENNNSPNFRSFHGHGTADFVVKYKWGIDSANHLVAMGANVQIKSYTGMGHSANPTEFRDVFDFLIELFKVEEGTCLQEELLIENIEHDITVTDDKAE